MSSQFPRESLACVDNGSSTAAKVWTYEEMDAFLWLRRGDERQIKNKPKTRKPAMEAISVKMSSSGYTCTPEKADNRRETLLNQFVLFATRTSIRVLERTQRHLEGCAKERERERRILRTNVR